MSERAIPHEVFRRSWLTLVPEWAAAAVVSLAAGLAALHFGLRFGWEATALVVLPLVWAGGRTLQWTSYTWTIEAGGRLVLKTGRLFPSRQVIQLCSASQVRDARLPLRWLDTGQIAFEATGEDGQRHHYRWTWMRSHDRLSEIVRARGRLPIGERAGRPAARVAAREFHHSISWPARPAPRREELHDHGLFLAFCHHVLRAGRVGAGRHGA